MMSEPQQQTQQLPASSADSSTINVDDNDDDEIKIKENEEEKAAAAAAAAQKFVNDFNQKYEILHMEFETQFWGTKMALTSSSSSSSNITYSIENLTKTKSNLENFLSNPNNIQIAKDYYDQLYNNNDNDDDSQLQKQQQQQPTKLQKQLDIIIKTCRCYDMSSSGPEAKQIRQETIELENKLELSRNRNLKLGYNNDDDDGGFCETSSVGLRNVIKTNINENIRKSAYNALRLIGPYCLSNGFIEIIILRTRLAKCLGYIDFYDYKVTQAEGFNKTKLFEILDELEMKSRPIMIKARDDLSTKFGPEALEPWNINYYISNGGSGSTKSINNEESKKESSSDEGSGLLDHQSKLDEYYPFGSSPLRLLKSYAALGITYENSIMNLDLLERTSKHDNGFCHWPRVSWIKDDGQHQPAITNFTTCADPTKPGSGIAALKVLFHEAGHAAHFANVKQPSPLFSQERPPTSVAYAETQSLFLDSLIEDCAWKAIYATKTTIDGDNNNNSKEIPIPFDLLETDIRCTHPYRVLELRGKLSVSYFEKALYELPIEELTPANIIKLADEIEMKIQGGLAPRPLLAYPHIISDEASCYYHGYVLAEMCVHQTRDYFIQRDGYIVNNPNVGPTLKKSYWECGSSIPFLRLVKNLTGTQLSCQSWITSLQENLELKIQRERNEYYHALESLSSTFSKGNGNVATTAAVSNTSSSSSSSVEETSCNDNDKNENENKNNNCRLDKILNMAIRFVDGDTLIADSSKLSGGDGGDGIVSACHEFEQFVISRGGK